jgi:hypothetical protein
MQEFQVTPAEVRFLQELEDRTAKYQGEVMPLLLEIVVCHCGLLRVFPPFDAVPVTGANVRRKTSQERIMDRAQN